MLSRKQREVKMINKKEPDLLIKRSSDFIKTYLYFCENKEGREIKFLKLDRSNLGLAICVYNEEQARNLLKTIMFDVVILPENFSPGMIKHLISKNYHAEFDSFEKEWSLYSNFLN